MNKTILSIVGLLSFSVLSYASSGANSWANTQKQLKEPQLCDIRQNPNLCECHAPSKSQISNAFSLTLAVGQKIKALEESEKKAGRDLKVVVIERAGSSLENFLSYSDYNSKGQIQNFKQFLDEMIVQSSIDSSIGHVALNWRQMLKRETPQRPLQYSHIALAFKNHPKSDQNLGFWQINQLLYNCTDGHSSVFQTGMTSFFLDDMKNYKARILVLPQEVQDRLEDLVLHHKEQYQFLSPHYNAASLYNDLRQQNSNSWVLEMIAAAMAEPGAVQNREQAVNYLTQTGYMGTKVRPKGVYSLIGLAAPFLPKTVCLSAQPAASAYALAEVVTPLSVDEYLKRRGALTSLSDVSIRSLPENTKSQKKVKCDRVE